MNGEQSAHPIPYEKVGLYRLLTVREKGPNTSNCKVMGVPKHRNSSRVRCLQWTDSHAFVHLKVHEAEEVQGVEGNKWEQFIVPLQQRQSSLKFIAASRGVHRAAFMGTPARDSPREKRKESHAKSAKSEENALRNMLKNPDNPVHTRISPSELPKIQIQLSHPGTAQLRVILSATTAAQ